MYGIPGNISVGIPARLHRVKVTFASATPVSVQLLIYNPADKDVVAVSRFAILSNGTTTLTLRPPANIPFYVAEASEDWWAIRTSDTVRYVANNTWRTRAPIFPID